MLGLYSKVLEVLTLALLGSGENGKNKIENMKILIFEGLHFLSNSILHGGGCMRIGYESEIINIIYYGIKIAWESKKEYELIIQLLKCILGYLELENDILKSRNVSVMFLFRQTQMYNVITEIYNCTKNKSLIEYSGLVLNEFDGNEEVDMDNKMSLI